MIGGLMQNSAKDTNGAVPWLSRLPLIGHLFRHKNRTAIKSELVILLRPVVVESGVQRSFLTQSEQNARMIRDQLSR